MYGNLTEVTSGTGVCFTRNPANGNKELFGEFLGNAQGEDVVAGGRTFSLTPTPPPSGKVIIYRRRWAKDCFVTHECN